LALVQATPDASEDERARELAEQHVIHVSRSTVNQILRRLRFTRKNDQGSERAPIKASGGALNQFPVASAQNNGFRTFFVDETGSTPAMARDHARAPRGQRVRDHVPNNYEDAITAIGALTADGLTAWMTIRGSTTKEVFRTYTKSVLAPQLRQGDVVVWDNPPAHNDPEIRKLVEEKGAKLHFLPPYSPDPNPIELAWA
jgi:hypothetical protein